MPLESKRFLERWKDNVQAVAGQPGFIRAHMYRSVADDAELRLVNTAERGSRNALAQARGNPGWRASMQRMLDDPDLHITPRAGVYQVAIDVHPAARGDHHGHPPSFPFGIATRRPACWSPGCSNQRRT